MHTLQQERTKHDRMSHTEPGTAGALSRTLRLLVIPMDSQLKRWWGLPV